MFSRFLHTAKSYISPTLPALEAITIAPPDESNPSTVQPAIPTAPTEIETTLLLPEAKIEATPKKLKTRVLSPDTMVTTRRSQQQDVKNDNVVEVEALTEEDSINVDVPDASSSAKSTGTGKGKKRGILGVENDGEVNGTPSRSAKKRKVSVDESEGVVMKSSRLVVEIPVSKEMKESAEKAHAERVAEKEKESLEAAKVHKKFGDDDEGLEEIFSTARDEPPVIVEGKGEEEDEDSDDEAPEEVGAQSAALEAKVQVESAMIAIQSLKKKRRERTSKAQAQAQSKNKPQKLTPEIEENPAENLSSPPSEASVDESSDDDDEEESVAANRSKPKRTAFDLPVQPKDVKVGSTIYRVSKESTKGLAPKAGKRAKDTKEDWLKGRNGKLGLGALRKPVKKSFC